MNIRTEDGLYGKGYVYTLYTLEDFDIYENYLNTIDNDYIKKYNPNFHSFKEDFKKYVGKLWSITKNETYRVIGIEDDDTMADWYWVLENIENPSDIIYQLANDSDFYKGLID